MRLTEEEFKELLRRNPDIIKGKRSKIAVSLPEEPAKAGKNKYRNIKVYVYQDEFASEDKNLKGHGSVTMVFDSVKEYRRWNELLLLEKAGKVSGVERQKSFIVQEGYERNEKKITPIIYRADFVYSIGDKTYVEDVKPFDESTQKYRLTKDFSLKWKILQYKYPEYEFLIY